MGVKRSDVGYLNLEIYAHVLFVIVLLCTASISHGYTNADDVQAMNMLYAALRYPPLSGWIPNGGDPCTENWKGVICNVTDIISITLNSVDLGGVLGDYLGTFHSIQTLDLSSNNIGGIIPSNLPPTIQGIFLADNNFTGSIPSTLSSLSLLKAVSLNGNLLTGEIPDTFEGLVNLVNLDFSSNNLSGELPPSLGTLLSLSTIHLQNNQLSGTLDVLQDLPLTELDITNNLFSGIIPEKMLSIPTFSKDGNLFNTSISPLPSSPSPPTLTPTPPLSRPPPSQRTPPSKQASGPSSTSDEPNKTSSFLTTKRVIWISIAAVLLFIILALAFVLFMPRWCRKRQVADRFNQRHETGGYKHSRENSGDNRPHVQSTNHLEKDPKEAVPVAKEGPKKETQKNSLIPKPREQDIKILNTLSRQESHEIDMTLYPPPPPPPPPSPPPIPPTTKVIVKPIEAPEEAAVLTPSTSVRSFTIASLQQYTNSFSQDNVLGTGMLGSVYRAELPNGKLLAVKKLASKTSRHQKDSEFIELVNSIDRIRHANVVELMGYCAEHGQRLLVYEYCSNGTVQDALHSDDEFKKKLSWNIRIQMALEAARALEYLHEVSQPPVVHRNFKSANVLLDDELSARVSDCGMAPLISLGSVSQLSGQLQSAYGYGAPEFESGIYTIKSDVYSFGVVMLELLTGRKSHDKKRIRSEQFLVRWAIPQLHDIDALSRMVDPSLGGEYPAKSLSHFADIISRCVQTEPEFRPPMSEIVQDLLDMIRKEPRHQYQKSY